MTRQTERSLRTKTDADNAVGELDESPPRRSTESEMIAGTRASGSVSQSNDSLDVCLLSYRSSPFTGGQGVYIKYLSRALVDLGHSVDVISGQPYPELDSDVNLIKLPGSNAAESDNLLAEFELGFFREPLKLVEWLSSLTGGFAEPYTFGERVARHFERTSHQYDIVHDNQSLSYGLLRLIREGIPTLATIHHPITVDRDIMLKRANSTKSRLQIRRWYRFLSMQKTVASQLPNLITVSQSAAQATIGDFDVMPTRLSVVYNGVDTDIFRPRRSVESDPARIMTTASADTPLKGLEYLLQAFSQLRDEGRDVELVLVGGIPEGGRISDLIYWLGIEDVVSVHNEISTERMVELYASASVAVVPSLFEGFGFPAAEAMACGVPIVATSGGALPEIVGDAGLIAPPQDFDALAEKIRTLLDSPKLRDQIGHEGRNRVHTNFCWKEAAKETVAVYRQTIESFSH